MDQYDTVSVYCFRIFDVQSGTKTVTVDDPLFAQYLLATGFPQLRH